MISSIVTPARPLLLNKWRALLRIRSRVSGFWLGGCGTGNTSALWLDPRGCPPDVLEHRRQMMFGTGVGATAAALGSVIPNIALAQPAAGSALKYSDGIAASRTMIAIAGNA